MSKRELQKLKLLLLASAEQHQSRPQSRRSPPTRSSAFYFGIFVVVAEPRFLQTGNVTISGIVAIRFHPAASASFLLPVSPYRQQRISTSGPRGDCQLYCQGQMAWHQSVFRLEPDGFQIELGPGGF